MSIVYQLAAELPVRGYVTTAFDALLVEALKMRSRRSDKVVRDADRRFTSETRASVVMLCGDCQQPDSLPTAQVEEALKQLASGDVRLVRALDMVHGARDE